MIRPVFFDPESRLHEYGSGLEVPGIEAVLEYGDVSNMRFGRLPGALGINDRAKLDRVHVSQLDGLNDDPEAADTRTANAGRYGESAGNLMPRGRTIGVTGDVRSSNVPRMRDLWRRFRAQFGLVERDLIVHPPGEVPLYTNQVSAGTYDANSVWAAAPSTSGAAGGVSQVTDGVLSAGELTVTGMSGAGSMGVVDSGDVVAWNGEDVWAHALLKAQAAAGTVQALTVYVVCYQQTTSGFTALSSQSVATQALPGTGTWRQISGRLAAGLVSLGTTHVGVSLIMGVPATAGAYTLRFARVAFVLLEQGAASPLGYVGPELPGYERDVYQLPLPTHSRSPGARSYGPCYQVNHVRDTALAWQDDSTSGATVVGPSTSYAWPIDDHSIYFKATNPSTTSRTLALRSASGAYLFSVAGGRSYRAYAHVLVAATYGAVNVNVVFLNSAGSVLSTMLVDVVPGVGEWELSSVFQAPDTAVSAYLRFVETAATTTSGAALELQVHQPRFVDVSEYDPGDVRVDGDLPVEQAVAYEDGVTPGAIVRRRVPRPFLLQNVRGLMDGKAPESQRSLRASRDFTMSLRAADPRVYVLDWHRSAAKLTGAPKFESLSPPLAQANLPPASGPPVGFAAQASSFDAATFWATSDQRGHALRGLVLGYTAGATTAASFARYYRVAVSGVSPPTYTTPQVTCGGAPTSEDATSQAGFLSQIASSGGTHNYVGVVVKRTASAWLALRLVTSSTLASGYSAGGVGATTHELQLWCSHNAGGTAAETLLAGWDTGSSAVFNGLVMKYVVASLSAANVVTASLWTNYPSGAFVGGTSGRLGSFSYTLPSPLVSLLGAGVSGTCGLSIRLDNWGPANVDPDVLGYPYISYYESRDASVGPAKVTCPVIGTEQTPLELELRGGVVAPIVAFSPPEGSVQSDSALLLSGTYTDLDPVLIDLERGRVTSRSGADRFSDVLPGSRFASLEPGVNTVAVIGQDFDAGAPAHVVASWRDALR